MKIFDFNIHLPYAVNEDVNLVIEQDMRLDPDGIIKGLATHCDHIRSVDGANFLLFNPRLFDKDALLTINTVKSNNSKAAITALIDFRRSDIRGYIEKAKAAGINAILFNSYLQEISNQDFKMVINACKIAEELGLIICIDGSYGTSKMFEFPNMKLACAVADVVTNTRIVIVHSGGYNVLQAMLLALDKTNVWLDTSFSLPYYIGSSIEQDFAFAYKKMDYSRIVFGSDHPYMNMEKTITVHKTFFGKYDFPDKAVEDIFYNNAVKLFKFNAE